MSAAIPFRLPEARPDHTAELRASLTEAFAHIQRGELPGDDWVEQTAFLLARTNNLKGQ